jgi:hypothetical protein
MSKVRAKVEIRITFVFILIFAIAKLKAREIVKRTMEGR